MIVTVFSSAMQDMSIGNLGNIYIGTHAYTIFILMSGNDM